MILESSASLAPGDIETWPVLRERSFGEFEGQEARRRGAMLARKPGE